MKWAIFAFVVALTVFAISAFMSRDKECGYAYVRGDGVGITGTYSCEITYWWG